MRGKFLFTGPDCASHARDDGAFLGVEDQVAGEHHVVLVQPLARLKTVGLNEMDRYTERSIHFGERLILVRNPVDIDSGDMLRTRGLPF